MRHVLAALILVLAAAAGAAAQGPYTVSRVPIDATASNTFEAQAIALRQGQAEAARRLIDRLTLFEDRMEASLPPLSNEEIAELIAGLQIADERRSGTRYIGVLTVNFDPRAVRRWLQSHRVPFVEAQARPVVVLPVLHTEEGGAALWDGNPWRETWTEIDAANALAPVILPSRETGRSLISASVATAMDVDALRDVALAHGAAEVAVLIARGGEDGMRYQGAVFSFADPSGEPVRAPVTASAGGFRAAAQRFIADREEAWKRSAIVRGGEGGEFAVTVLYGGISEWQALRGAITGASLVTNARLDALSRDGAMMTLTHRGDRAQLITELDARGAALTEDREMGWVIRPAR